ncbi:MAG TPA: CapA family protein [Gemmatimonadales bacterium]|nr:CapA family protein [Gemmatimonadales bacterium]
MRSGAALALAFVTILAGCSSAPPPVTTPAPAPEKPREPAPEPAPKPTPPPIPTPPPVRTRVPVRLAFVGDINLGTTTLPDGVPPDSGRAFLSSVRPFLNGDLVVGNLEGVLADTGTSEKCVDRTPRRPAKRSRSRPVPPDTTRSRPGCYAFLTPVHLAPRLREAGFTHLGLANNHAHDYGLDGRASTERTLTSLGLKWYGPLGHIAIDTVRRGDSVTVVGLVGFATYPHSYDLLDIPRSVTVVDSVERLTDIVVVTFHGGTEGAAATRVGPGPEFLGKEPRGDLRAWAHAVVDAGADLVVGHGPHVLRGMEWYRDRLIAYSLGNFATYRGFSLAGPLGITGVLRLTLASDGRVETGRLIPMRQEPRSGPLPDGAANAVDLVNRLSTDDFGPDAVLFEPDGTLTHP